MINVFKNTDCFWVGQLAYDWPLMRYFIKKNHTRFNKFYYVVNYTTDIFNNRPDIFQHTQDHVDMIREDLKNYNFEIIYINTDYSCRDWRDQCFNEFLKKSRSEYIFHLDPDVYIEQEYIEHLSTLSEFDFRILCPRWGSRIWPFLFASRNDIDQTSRDFTTNTICSNFIESIYNKTQNLKLSCDGIRHNGDHGDKLILELLELTNFSGWKFFQDDDVVCKHYNGRTYYHMFLQRRMHGLVHESDNATSHTILTSQRYLHIQYLERISNLNINLFDFYKDECKFFYENEDLLGQSLHNIK